MRLIVDRQQMIDQTLSGYGSLGNDLYAPFDAAYASDLPQREQDIDQAKSLLAAAGPGGPAGRAVHRRRHRLGRPGRGQPLRRAGQGRRRRRQGHQEDAVLRRPVPLLPVRPGLLEHAQLHPAGRGRHVPAGPGRHLQRDPLGQPEAPRPRQQRGAGARRGQAQRAAPPGTADRVRRGRPRSSGASASRSTATAPTSRASSRASTSRSGPTSSTRSRSRDMTDLELATLVPDPLEEVAPPRGQHGAAAWAVWLARRLGPGRADTLAGLGPGVRGDGRPGRPGPRHPRPRLQRQPRTRRGAGGAAQLRRAWSSRYLDWLGGLLTGDLGTSLATGLPVCELIPTAWSTPRCWCSSRRVVMIPLAFAIAMISAHYRRRRPDTVIQTILLAMAGLPEFVIGVLLIALFSTTVFHDLPGGDDQLADGAPVGQPEGHGPADADPGAVGGAVRLAHRPRLAARGDRQRLRRAGPPQGHPREGRDAQARAAQRDRAGHPGDRAPAGLPGRRRRGRGDVCSPTPGSAASSSTPSATTTCRWSRR